MKIAIRCDGSRELGMGHVTECLSLAASITRQSGEAPVFLSLAETPGIRVLREAGAGVEELRFTGDEEELAAVRAAMERFGDGHLIVSLPHKTAAFYGQLKSSVPSLTAVFDDGLPHPNAAHQIIDYCLRPQAAAPDDGAEHLLGPEFCLLDEILHDYWTLERATPSECRKLFVNQGGSDPFGLTPKVLRALAKAGYAGSVVAVLGAAVSDDLIGEVSRISGSLPFECRVERALSQRDVYALMDSCDAAVTAAGNTLYELSTLGLASAIISHHERHDAVAREFDRCGTAMNIGIGTSTTEERLASGLREFLGDSSARRRMSLRGKELVDGLGCSRAAARILAFATARR